MGVIPPPIVERPARPFASVFVLGCGVLVLVTLAVALVLAFVSYRRLDAPPAEAAAKRAAAAEMLETQASALESSRADAAAAVDADFDYDRTLRRWYRQGDPGVRALLRGLLRYPEGLPDAHWIIHANCAAASDDWPEALDPGRHDLDALRRHAAEWLAADDDFQALVAAIRHGIAWRVRDATGEEYRPDEPYLEALDELGVALALSGLAAARAGEREGAWEHLELLAELGRQLLREPDTRAAVTALTLQFHADFILWALLDDGPFTPGEQGRYASIGAFRADPEPLRNTLSLEAALAPGRTEASGIFPRMASRVLFDRFWEHQQALIDALDEPPHEAIAPLRQAYLDLPLHADETSERMTRNLYLYRLHWQSRYHWELAAVAAALKDWKGGRGDYPVTLDDMVAAGALEALPEDPVWGEPIHYARLGDGFALYLLRIEDRYWLYDYWLDESDPNSLHRSYGLDWEVIWRALQ